MCVCIAVFESILRVKIGNLIIWWVPLIRLFLFCNKVHVYENTESFIILKEIRSLLGGSSEHSFREYRPCYVHGRTHVEVSDVAKCGEVSWPTSQIKRYTFTVTLDPLKAKFRSARKMTISISRSKTLFQNLRSTVGFGRRRLIFLNNFVFNR